ncbi:MAG: hypothetical protein KGI29_01045 [Pseudomonadota bacterium]|nr:hypothetical protein [Pseudomonadota bacterium]MDE3037047.1 hypothetical protein [Pseudomonadota bacterium]
MNETPHNARPARILSGLLLLAVALAIWMVFMRALPRLTLQAEPVVSRPAPNHLLSDLQHHLDQSDAKIKALEDVIAAPRPPGDADAKIAALQAKVDALAPPSHVGDSAPNTHLEALVNEQQLALQALSARLDAVETRDAHRLTALAALGMLEDAVRHGNPFAAPLATLTQVTADNASVQALLAQLAPYAEKGTATLAQLQDEFENAIPAALSAGDETGWRQYLRTLVSIRRIGDQPGSGDDAVIARAEIRLGDGEIEKAANALAELSPKASAAFASWRSQAQDCIRINGALAALRPALLQDRPAATPAPAPETAPAK